MYKKLKLHWQGGESRTSKKVVDWMKVVDDEGVEILYAESEWNFDEDEFEESYKAFWDCLQQIAEKSEETGIDLNNVHNVDFEHFGSPIGHFESINDVYSYFY